jgi:hypothetical protein
LCRFNADHPGKVFARVSDDSTDEVEFELLKKPLAVLSRFPPPAIQSSGLDLTRQWYLYNNIRQFALEHSKDVLCPKPSSEVLALPSSAVSSDSDSTHGTPIKKARGKDRGSCRDGGRGRGRGSSKRGGRGRGRVGQSNS